ncbi:MAG: hypothetical protein HYT12_00200 [Candidatus Liptonbacteria bacterium]|nr:hypothetical protein [Candidatus Liptonbacteria bacterium]
MSNRVDMSNEAKKKLIQKFKEIGVIKKEKVKLKHGGASRFYVDVKKTYGYPDILNELCKRVYEGMPETVSCIAAGGYGGLPLASTIALKYKLRLVLVRDKPKKHGRNAWIDGYVPNRKDKTWIVDDVLTTGKSIIQMAQIVRSTKAKVIGCGVVVRRGRRKLAIPCEYLMTAEDLM